MKNFRISMLHHVLPAIAAMALAGCSGGTVRGATSYTVGGVVLGLGASESITLQDNATDDLVVAGSASFTFVTSIADRGSYDVTVFSAPAGKSCTVSNNEGQISGANVTNVHVMCSSSAYTIGGTVSGLGSDEALILQNSLDDDMVISAEGSFVFPISVANGGGYDVTVLEKPDDRTCSVGNGSGTVEGADITDVSVVCHALSYTVGGSVTGLQAGDTLILRNNSKDDLTMTADGAFTFSAPVANGAIYHVTVYQEPWYKFCIVTNDAGIIDGANIDDVSVECSENVHSIMFLSSTSALARGDFGGVSKADMYCQWDENCPAGATCKALITDGTTRVACTTPDCEGGVSEHIDWVLAPDVEYRRTDRTTTIGVTNSAGIFNFPLNNSLGENLAVWTGLSGDWTNIDHDCIRWTSISSGAGVGMAGHTDRNFIFGDDQSCESYLVFYCVEQNWD